MNSKVSFYTLGCRLNQAETAILQTSFRNEGFSVVDFNSPANIVVINTCTVTENGDADTRKLVNKINRVNPNARIALVGCQAQIQREKLLNMPNVKWVVGNSRKMELANILKEGLNTKESRLITPVIRREPFFQPAAGIDRKHTRANLKIQDGCDFFCSFCVIPYARGRARSRIFGDILTEAQVLTAAGHQELVLTGINVGTYQYQDKSVLEVVDALLALPALKRLRISSIEPTTIPLGLLEFAGRNAKFCRYFHIPLQSGSNRVLERMNRKYDKEQFKEFILHTYNLCPEVCIGTDVIVGFPGETEQDFEETRMLLTELPLSYFHVFSYSERPWAKSRRFDNKVDREEIERRSKFLRSLSSDKRKAFLNRNLGKVETVLFEQTKNGFWNGLTDTYIRVKVKSGLDLKNRMLPVKLDKAENNFVYGRLIST